jgi:hypothetical protein
MKMEIVYKIRHKETGLFHKGGMIRGDFNRRSNWSPTGKKWSKLGHVKLHINQSLKEYEKHEDEFEIVEYTFVEGDTYTPSEILDDMKSKREIREKVRREAHLQWKAKRAVDQLIQAKEAISKEDLLTLVQTLYKE